MAETYLSGMHTPEGRRALAEVLLALFRRWDVDEAGQAALLGVAEAEVHSLWRGVPLPSNTAVLERAGLLLAIDRLLNALFADEPLMRERWVAFPNAALEGCAPLDVMLDGEQGIRRVHDLLKGQSASGSQAP